jgi:outer membrane protein assembly factor BamB
MNNIEEIKRLASPAPVPQGLAWHNENLWMGSMTNKTVHQIDPNTGESIWETPAPGTPFGITSVDDELRVLCGETEEDFRIIRRLIPNEGFNSNFNLPCPQDTGSQLSFNGRQLHVSQWYNKVVLAIDDNGNVQKSYESPHGIAGQVIVDNRIYLVTTDAEETNEYFLTQVDLESDTANDIAKIPFPARALAFDGKNFWTNHRAADQIVCFKRPD